MDNVRLYLEGAPGEISVEEFLGSLSDAVELLRDLERAVLGGRRGKVDWRIADLAVSSAVAEITPVPVDDVRAEDATTVTDQFLGGLQMLELRPGLPPAFSEETVAVVRRLANRVGRGGVSGLRLIRGNEEVTITRSTADNAATTLRSETTVAVGSVVGHLDAINVHERAQATLYEALTGRAVRLHFPMERLEEIKSALRRRVEVRGRLRRDAEGRLRRVDLLDLEVIPFDDELPSVADVEGIARGFTGDMTTEEFVRWARNG